MAVQFPAGIYTEGQGLFDSRPYLKLVEAKQKAKQEAFTKYLDKVNSQVNIEGVRDQDRLDPVTGRGLEQDVQNLQKFGIENQGEIMRNGPARLKFEQMIRDARWKAALSKSRAKLQSEIGTAAINNKIYLQDDDLEVAQRLDHSIYDPRSYKEHYISEAQGLPEYTQDRGTEFGWQDLSAAVNTLKAPEMQSMYKAYLGDKAPMVKISEKTTAPGLKELVMKYDDNYLKTTADRLGTEIAPKPIDAKGRSLKKTYNAKLDDPDWLAKAEPIYQKFYQKPIETAQDALRADFLLQYAPATIPKTERFAVSRPRAGGAGGVGGTFYDADKLIMEKFEKDKSLPRTTGYTYTQINSLPNTILKEAIVEQANVAQKKTKAGKAPFTDKNIFLASDPTTDQVAIYTTVNNPTMERNARTFVAYYDRDAANLYANQKLGTKAKATAITTPAPAKAAAPKGGKFPLPKGQPRTVKQGGFTYTWNENTGQYE